MKKPLESLPDWDWTVLVAAWRYYEHGHTIASATFPNDIITRYWRDTKTYGDGVRKQIARQFVNIDHHDGPDNKISGWVGTDTFGACDREAWRLFYWFLKAENDNSWKKFLVINGRTSGKVACFNADGKWYAKEGYIRHGDYCAPYEKKMIKEVK